MLKNGYSLLELLMVLAIIAIASAIALPSYQHFFQDTQALLLQEQLFSSLQSARHEAMSRGQTVLLCPSSDHKHCQSRWADGYLMIIQDEIIQKIKAVHTDGQLYWQGLQSKQAYLKFTANGMMLGENGTFWYCANKTEAPAWAIVISPSGRMRIEKQRVLLKKCRVDSL